MKHNIILFSAALVSAILFSSCGGNIPTHYETAKLDAGLQEEKEKLAKSYQELFDYLKTSGLIGAKPEFTEYVSKIGARLVPENLRDNMVVRYHMVRDPIPNAFALDSGDIFINLGLFAFMENESQLASVIAHEISHAIHRHGIEAYVRHKKSTIAANISDVFLLGTGLSYLGAYANIAVHSRESEREADASGIELMEKAGYDSRETAKAFEMFNRLPQQKAFLNSIYSSHPENQERLNYLAAMTGAPEKPISKSESTMEEYKAFRLTATEESLGMLLYNHQYVVAEHLLSTARSYFGPEPRWDLHEAEIRRLKAFNPMQVAQDRVGYKERKSFEEESLLARSEVDRNLDKARALFEGILKQNPSTGMAHRGLGLMEWEKGNKEVAKDHFRQYLLTRKDAPDSLYINRLLSQ